MKIPIAIVLINVFCSPVSSVIDNRCQDDTALEVENSENTVYAVFVSFAEIYNEYIYDLLEKMPTCKKNKRNPLMLGEDRNSAIYIKGKEKMFENVVVLILITIKMKESVVWDISIFD